MAVLKHITTYKASNQIKHDKLTKAYNSDRTLVASISSASQFLQPAELIAETGLFILPLFL